VTVVTPAEAAAALTGPGGQYEIVVEDVLGVPLQVYRNRFGSMRDLVAIADSRPDQDWVVQDRPDGTTRRVTFGEHNAMVRTMAASLRDLGLEPGDRLALLSANTVEWVVVFWACASIGVACVPLNAWWKGEELEFALRDSGAKVLVCDAKRWQVVRDVVPSIDSLAHVFVMDLDAPEGGARPASDLLGGGDPGALPDVSVAEDDILAILYTSGTTGQPKGATLTHRQALANLQNLACLNAIAAASRAGADDAGAGAAPPEPQGAALLVVPLFHVTGALATMVVGYAAGTKLVLMPPGKFDPDVAMRIIERERVTSMGGVPTVMWRIVEAPTFGQYDLSSVTRIGYGGAPAAPELVERIKVAFPKVRQSLSTAYGLTETASVATVNAGENYFTHPGSVGRPAPTVEVQVVDPEGRPLGPGEVGEIALRGPTVMMRGYWSRPDATDAAFLPGGWFRTGDIGRLDEDGFLYLVDRAKDMIIRAGENVYCVEVEHVLHEHPDVLDVAVVGVPHRELGEEVKAVVQLRPGSTATDEDIRAHAAQHLAAFKVPEHVELRDEPLPRNPAGKILKNLLRGDGSAFAPSADDDSAL
jgi:long-chain acyl-CoA synthetase